MVLYSDHQRNSETGTAPCRFTTDYDIDVGVLLPCNVVVYEGDNGGTVGPPLLIQTRRWSPFGVKSWKN